MAADQPDDASQQEAAAHFFEALERATEAEGAELFMHQDGRVAVAFAGEPPTELPVRELFRRVYNLDRDTWQRVLQEQLHVRSPGVAQQTGDAARAGLEARAGDLLPCLKPASYGRLETRAWAHALAHRDPMQERIALTLASGPVTDETMQRIRAIPSQPSPETALLYLTLVVDLPDTMSFVTDPMLAEAGRPADEWVARAKQNLIDRTPDDWFVVEHPESGICRINVNDSYDAPRALVLDELLPGRADRGWFVAPIAREEVYFVPVSGANWFPARGDGLVLVPSVNPLATTYLPMLKRLAEQEYPKTNYALSDQLFWVYQGAWYHYRLESVDGNTLAIPPQEFLNVLGE